MKLISDKPLIHITPEEEKAIKIVAKMFDFFNEIEIDYETAHIESGDELCDFFFDNNCFNCEVEGKE